MDERFRRIDNIAAKVYAAFVLLFGLALAFMAYVFLGTHLKDEAIFPLVPALALVALSVFIWRGAMWAMIVVAVCLLGFVIFFAFDDPSFLLWLPIPAVFGILTAVCIGCRLKTRAA